MSILALNNALSGLKTSQRALGVISDNIANANTEGYVRKVAEPSSIVLDGQGSGVEIGRISRVVDEYLLRERREEVGELKAVETLEIYFNEVQDLFGQPGDNNSIASLMERLQTALQNFEISPEDSFRAQQVVDAAEDIAVKLNDMHYTLQDLRARADNEIGDDVTTINALLNQIDEFNVDIITAEAKGQDAGGLRDKRDVALNNLSELVGITYFENSDGAVTIQTSGGKTLLDVDPITVFHDVPNGLRSNIAFDPDRVISDPDLGTIRGILVGGLDEQNDITGELRRGEIKGLVDLRDTILPALTSELDELTRQLREGINAVHNLGSAYPPPNSLIGQRDFIDFTPNQESPSPISGNEIAFNGTGVIRVSVLQSNPPAQRGQTVATFNLDLDYLRSLEAGVDLDPGAGVSAKLAAGGQLSVEDVRAALQAQLDQSGTVGTVQFSGGRLSIQVSDPDQGIVIDAPENVVASNLTGAVLTFGANTFTNATIAPTDINLTTEGAVRTFTLPAAPVGGYANIAAFAAEINDGPTTVGVAPNVRTLTATALDNGILFQVTGPNGVEAIEAVGGGFTIDLDGAGAGTVTATAANVSTPPTTATAAVTGLVSGNTFQIVGENASQLGVVTVSDVDLDGNLSLQDLARAINDPTTGVPGVSARVQSYVGPTAGNTVFRLEITADDGQTITVGDLTGTSAQAAGLLSGAGTTNTFNSDGGSDDPFAGKPSVQFLESKSFSNPSVTIDKIDGIETGVLPGQLTLTTATGGTAFTANFNLQTTSLANIVDEINIQQIQANVQAAILGAGGAAAEVTAALAAVEANFASDNPTTIAAAVNAAVVGAGGAAATATAAENAVDDPTAISARLVNVDGWKIEISSADGSTISASGDVATALDLDSQTFGFSHYFGLNDFFEYSENFSAASDLMVRDAISDDPNLLVRAQAANSILSPADVNVGGGATTTALTAGDNDGAKALAEAMIATRTFEAAGDLPEITLSLPEYAARILSNQALRAAANGDDLQFREDVVGELSFRIEGISGVNIDEELSNLILFQNAFTASARVISASQELLDELVNIVR